MTLADLKNEVRSKAKSVSRDHSCLVGLSGIDASGKGYVAKKLSDELESIGFRVASINVDCWLNLPEVRFGGNDPGHHFYINALRLNEMFEHLVLPLKFTRSVRLTMNIAEETATAFRPQTFDFNGIDILLLEGILIFKREFVTNFDLKIWVECSFEKALERAIARRQENLSPEATIDAYEKIYFPAQKIHFDRDDPVRSADLIYSNQ